MIYCKNFLIFILLYSSIFFDYLSYAFLYLLNYKFVFNPFLLKGEFVFGFLACGYVRLTYIKNYY